jgi:hypothetical protein
VAEIGYTELLDVKDESTVLRDLVTKQAEVVSQLQAFYSCMERNAHGDDQGSNKRYRHRLLATAGRRIDWFKGELDRLIEASEAACESVSKHPSMPRVQIQGN